MAELVPDVVEKILITLDVKDLIRCKSVCKFWHSLISSSQFVTAHMNHSYNNDRNNDKFGQRRILMSMSGYEVNGCYGNSALLGSSNGLVCISNSTYEIIVANPSTREVKKLQRPQSDHKRSTVFGWGFGYDYSTDDYKVVLVYVNGCDQTCCQVFSLKSNVWKVLGKQKYTCHKHNGRKAGTLCNGALHWFMKDQNNKSVIISFDLSKEVFKEIPHPNDTRCRFNRCCLGIFDECLCVYMMIDLCDVYCKRSWIMKKYDVQESWALLTRKNNDVAHYLRNLKDYIPHTSFYANDLKKNYLYWEFFQPPIFVQSLVSPYVYESKRK